MSVYESILGNDKEDLRAQCENWSGLVENHFSVKTEITFDRLKEYFVSNNFQTILPLVFSLFKLYLTLPISNASSERSFSSMKFLKSYLRNTMEQVRLSSLAVLYIEKESAKNFVLNDVINEFAQLKKRRWLLT